MPVCEIEGSKRHIGRTCRLWNRPKMHGNRYRVGRAFSLPLSGRQRQKFARDRSMTHARRRLSSVFLQPTQPIATRTRSSASPPKALKLELRRDHQRATPWRATRDRPEIANLAATNKCLAKSNKSRTGGEAIKKRIRKGSGTRASAARRRHKPMTLQEAKSIARHLGRSLRQLRACELARHLAE
jgi:hypothetical protein